MAFLLSPLCYEERGQLLCWPVSCINPHSRYRGHLLIGVCLPKRPLGFIYRSCLSCQVVLNSCKLNESWKGGRGSARKIELLICWCLWESRPGCPVTPGALSIRGHPAGRGKQVVPLRQPGVLLHCWGARGLSDEGRLGGIFIARLSGGPGGDDSHPGVVKGTNVQGSSPRTAGCRNQEHKW